MTLVRQGSRFMESKRLPDVKSGMYHARIQACRTSRLPKLRNTWHRLLTRLDSSNFPPSYLPTFTDTKMSTPFSHSREVVYITTSQEANEELRLMSDRGYKVVGFDTESLPGDKDRHRGKIAVIQVSDAEKALVINVSHINQGAVSGSFS